MSHPIQCPSCGVSLTHEAECTSCALLLALGVLKNTRRLEETSSDVVASTSVFSDFADYEIGEEIGRGGMGVVYAARQKSLNREVALKMILAGQLASEHTVQRFRFEAESAARLEHPNILPVYEVGEHDTFHYFSMRLIAGARPASVLALRTGSRAEHLAVAELMAKVAHAVGFAHGRGLLHRDLKSANVIVDRDGEPYIADFGLAKIIEGESAQLTMTETLMGTPSYLAPEQVSLDDSGKITTSTDIYGLGAILYELLTGRPPFVGSSTATILRKVAEETPWAPSQIDSSVDADLEVICLRCLEKEPHHRFATAEDLAAELERFIRGEPIQSRPIGPFRRLLRWCRRKPALASMAALFGIAIVTGTIVSVIFGRQAIAEREVAEENAYFALVGSALSARESSNFGEALRLLSRCSKEMQDRFEWRLVHALSDGDEVWRTEFGIGNPLHLAQTRLSKELRLLTRDRHLHTVNPKDGTIVRSVKIPNTVRGSMERDPPTLRSFDVSPDGEYYLFIDGNDLVIVADKTQSIIHQTKMMPGSSALWLDPSLVLYALPPGELGADMPEESAWLYDVSDGSTTPLRRGDWSAPMAVSQDGTRVAIVRRSKKVVLYEANRDSFMGASDFKVFVNRPIKELAFSGDGKMLAIHSGEKDSYVDIYDVLTNERTFADYWPTPLSIGIAPGTFDVMATDLESWFMRCRALGAKSRKDLLSRKDYDNRNQQRLPEDGPIAPPSRTFHKTKTGVRKKYPLGHQASLVSYTGIPGEGFFITASKDGSLRSWKSNIRTVSSLRLDDPHTAPGSYHPTASHNGEYVALQRQGRPYRWTRWVPDPTALPEDHLYLAVFDNGRVLTLDQNSNQVVCWEISRTPDADIEEPDILGKPKEVWRIGIDQTAIHSHIIHTSVTPDEQHVACLFSNQILFIEVTNRKVLTVPIEERLADDVVSTISLSPDGRKIAVTGGHDFATHLYDSANLKAGFSKVVAARTDARDTVSCFSIDGNRLYVGNDRGKVRVYTGSQFQEVSEESWQAHSHPITALAVSQEGDMIATAGGSSITLWSSEKEPRAPRRHRLQINSGPGSRNWLQFCRNDTLLMHVAPDRPLEVIEAPLRK